MKPVVSEEEEMYKAMGKYLKILVNNHPDWPALIIHDVFIAGWNRRQEYSEKTKVGY